MPRPDVAALGLEYRRIPIMAIGNSVILDSSLQVTKLEELPSSGDAVIPSPSPVNVDHKAIQFLVSRFVCKVLFRTLSYLMRVDKGFLASRKFNEDRSKLLGGDFKQAVLRRQPGAMAEVIAVFEFLENTLLTDGRKWLLNTEQVTSVDIEAAWALVWIDGMDEGLPQEHFSEQRFPKVRAWMNRYRSILHQEQQKRGPVEDISGDEAAKLIKISPVNVEEAGVNPIDPVAKSLGLSKGDLITIWTNDVPKVVEKDTGKLVALLSNEIVMDVTTPGGTFRVYAPRNGFEIQKQSSPRL